MFVVEGRGTTTDEERRAVAGVYDLVGRAGRPAVWVWEPPRQVAFGPRDVRHEGYPAAARAARALGYPAVERSVGGHPVAHTGSTLAFVRAEPVADPRRGLRERYERALDDVGGALADVGVEAERGEPPRSFCPGEHSLSSGGKIVGVAQRITADLAATAGVVVVADAAAVARVLGPVYAALGIDLDPGAVGSVADAGGPADGAAVGGAIRRRLLAGADAEAVPVRRLLHGGGDA